MSKKGHREDYMNGLTFVFLGFGSVFTRHTCMYSILWVFGKNNFKIADSDGPIQGKGNRGRSELRCNNVSVRNHIINYFKHQSCIFEGLSQHLVLPPAGAVDR
jgi:hypothetical protein